MCHMSTNESKFIIFMANPFSLSQAIFFKGDGKSNQPGSNRHYILSMRTLFIFVQFAHIVYGGAYISALFL